MFRTLLLLSAIAVASAEPPIPPDVRKEMIAGLEASKQQATAALEANPNSTAALATRGHVRLFLGDAKGAVADFEKEIALDPSHDAPHWQLGIAYWFAGDFAKSAKQFEKYHAYDDHDRENGVWQYLANARVVGVEKARMAMLPYTKFDREPFPTVYDMLAGKVTGDALLAEMETKGLGKNPTVMFFAHYYIGLNDELLGKKDSALEHLAKAVKFAMEAGAGDLSYMGQVARLNYEQLAK